MSKFYELVSAHDQPKPVAPLAYLDVGTLINERMVDAPSGPNLLRLLDEPVLFEVNLPIMGG